MSSAMDHTASTTILSRKLAEATQLSMPPEALPKLMEALGNSELGPSELARIIEQFPSIGARLVALVNSAWSAPVEPMLSIERACSHLGLRLVHSVSISLAVMAPFDPTRCPGFESEIYWCNTFLVADSAAQLAACANTDGVLSPDTARTAGLFYNLGLLWLADNFPRETERALITAREEGIDINESLRVYCGTDACQMGGRLGRAWGLPQGLVAAIEHRCNPEYDGIGWQVASLLQSATGIVNAVTSGEEESAIEVSSGRLIIDANDHDKIVANVAARFGETLELAKSLKL